jgi:hypothetical protein
VEGGADAPYIRRGGKLARGRMAAARHERPGRAAAGGRKTVVDA